jgi:hypothetical protein
VVCLAPRALRNCAPSGRRAGASVRPLNFTVRRLMHPVYMGLWVVTWVASIGAFTWIASLTKRAEDTFDVIRISVLTAATAFTLGVMVLSVLLMIEQPWALVFAWVGTVLAAASSAIVSLRYVRQVEGHQAGSAPNNRWRGP